MRIALDGLPLCQLLTGIGHYTFELAQHLAAVNPDDCVDVVSPRSFVTSLPVSQTSVNLRLLTPTRNPILRYWWTTALPQYLKRNDVAVFHGTNYQMPRRANCATVVTIHDLSTLLVPHTHEFQNAARARKRLPAMAAGATVVITPTECVRQEVHERLSIPLERIRAIPEAARRLVQDNTRPSNIKTSFGIRDGFVLYVGTVEPRKNLLALIQAFEQLPDRHGRLQLVIAGKTGWLVNDLFDYVRRSLTNDRVIFTGYVSDPDLACLYASCGLFVYPSIYEGFGLPPLEAMAAGAPVIASRIPTAEEVLGSAAWLVEPVPEAIRGAIVRLLDDKELRAEFTEAGKLHTARFSWEQAAARVREVYVEAVDRFAAENRRG